MKNFVNTGFTYLHFCSVGIASWDAHLDFVEGPSYNKIVSYCGAIQMTQCRTDTTEQFRFFLHLEGILRWFFKSALNQTRQHWCLFQRSQVQLFQLFGTTVKLPNLPPIVRFGSRCFKNNRPDWAMGEVCYLFWRKGIINIRVPCYEYISSGR